MKQRLLSALILTPAALGLIWLGGWFFGVLVFCAAAIALKEWYGMGTKLSHVLPVLVAGFSYILLSSLAFFYIRTGFEQGALLSIALLLTVAASDSGAYFVGKTIGGPKMAPVISPKKTWAGFGGAVFFSGLMLALCFYFFAVDQRALIVFATGCFLGVVAQAGDLLVSLLKRKAEIKDTGNLIPGHGGILDRIDSLLLVSPVFLFFILVGLQ